jgi:hypothetical protein
MSTYYLSAELSRYVDEHGGKDFLKSLVIAHEKQQEMGEKIAEIQEAQKQLNDGAQVVIIAPGDYIRRS